MTIPHAMRHTANAQKRAHEVPDTAENRAKLNERRALKSNDAQVGPGGRLIYPMPPPKHKKRKGK